MGPVERAPPTQRFFIVLIDYYSKWPEVQAVSSVTSSTVINFLKDVFAREGSPCELVTDNGVQFVSREFQAFLREYGIKHLKTSLYHPQCNGQVERFNHVLKSCLQLAVVQARPLPDAVRDYLEAYRRTKHPATGQPPSFLLHGRIHRSKLDLQGLRTREVPLDPLQRENLHERVLHYQHKMKMYSDRRRAVRRPQFGPGQAVRIFYPQHRNKLQSRFSKPQVIHAQVGPSTYQFADGRRWNAARLTKAPMEPQTESEKIDDWEDDDNYPLPTQQPQPVTPPAAPTVCPTSSDSGSGQREPSLFAVTGTQPVPDPDLPVPGPQPVSELDRSPTVSFSPLATSTPIVSRPGAATSMPPLEDTSLSAESVSVPSVQEPAASAPPVAPGRPVRQRNPPGYLANYVLSFFGNSSATSTSDIWDI